MNRRGFLSSLAAMATSAAFPKIPSIPLSYNTLIAKLYFNASYGKSFMGGRVLYADTDGIISTDIVSAYPEGLK